MNPDLFDTRIIILSYLPSVAQQNHHMMSTRKSFSFLSGEYILPQLRISLKVM